MLLLILFIIVIQASEYGIVGIIDAGGDKIEVSCYSPKECYSIMCNGANQPNTFGIAYQPVNRDVESLYPEQSNIKNSTAVQFYCFNATRPKTPVTVLQCDYFYHCVDVIQELNANKTILWAQMGYNGGLMCL